MVQIFLVSHMKIVRNKKDSHHPKLIQIPVFDSQAYVGISTIIRLRLFYISRNSYKYKTNVYTAGVNRLLNTIQFVDQTEESVKLNKK
jgi:hypothetical protein